MYRFEWFYDGCADERSLALLDSCYRLPSAMPAKPDSVHRHALKAVGQVQ